MRMYPSRHLFLNLRQLRGVSGDGHFSLVASQLTQFDRLVAITG